VTAARSGVGFVTHPSSLTHEMPGGHPERAERIGAVVDHLRRHGLIDRLESHGPAPASRTTIELAHDTGLIDLLHELDAEGGGRIDGDTSMGAHSLEAALRASQGAVDAVEHVLDGRWTSALCCFRPPGHHATTSRAMGFCLTNHVAIAARSAISLGAVDRAVILDWDAHHGNGTQDIFWTDASVLYVSLHQYPWYPGTGDATERGEGDGAGTTINVPLPAGAAEDAYLRAFDEVIEPAVADFDPQLVLVSAGYDAHHRDPLCMMRLTSGAFDRMTRRASAWGPGPVCVLEGGYDLDALAWSAGATVAAMLGDDPQAGGVPVADQGVLPGEPEAMRWVERAAALARRT
jgi:acetoin utilization deacetylase AcuC-like enzyme